MIARQFSLSALYLLALALLFHLWVTPDVWYHLFLGRGVLATGKLMPPDFLVLKSDRLVNIYWLFEVSIYGVYHWLGGVPALSLAFAAIWIATFTLWWRGVGKWGGWLFPIAFFGLMTLRMRFYEQRPEAVSYLLLTWMLTRTARPRSDTRGLAALGLVEALWANCHSFFVMGPLVFLWRFVTAARPREWAPALAAVVAATFVSPLGWRTWLHTLRTLRAGSAMSGKIAEVLPTWGFVPSNPVLWLSVALWAFVVCLIAVSLRRGRLFEIGLAVAGLVGSAMAVRFVPLLAVLALPLLRECAREFPYARPRIELGAAIGVVVLAIWVLQGGFYARNASIHEPGVGISDASYPTGFANYLDGAGGKFPGKIFNDPQTGGYLEFRFPALRLYGDTRFMGDPFLVDRYLAAPMNFDALKAIDAEERFAGYLLRISYSGEIVARFLRDAELTLAYSDLHYAFFVRRGTPMPLAVPHFYAGQDLWRLENRGSSLRWAQALTYAPHSELVTRALSEWSASPRIATSILGYALNYADAHSDPGLTRLALSLTGRAKEIFPGENEELGRLAKFLGERRTMR